MKSYEPLAGFGIHHEGGFGTVSRSVIVAGIYAVGLQRCGWTLPIYSDETRQYSRWSGKLPLVWKQRIAN